MQEPLRSIADINGHIVGTVIKEAIRRAIGIIRKEQHAFKKFLKPSKTKKQDFVTTADLKAQKMYVKLIREWFPTFGIIAEEQHVRIPCKEPNVDIYFVLDPADGTSALIRRQSNGIGTMVALVSNGEVIAAWVGDIMTEEIYYYRPGSPFVHRISNFEQAENLCIDTKLGLKDQYASLRDHPALHSNTVQSLVYPNSGLFKGLNVGGGSIGIDMARLWKSEIGALILRPSHETPWDLAPVAGISQKLGFLFVELDEQNKDLIPVKPKISKKIERRDREVIVVHQSRRHELISWYMKNIKR